MAKSNFFNKDFSISTLLRANQSKMMDVLVDDILAQINPPTLLKQIKLLEASEYVDKSHLIELKRSLRAPIPTLVENNIECLFYQNNPYATNGEKTILIDVIKAIAQKEPQSLPIFDENFINIVAGDSLREYIKDQSNPEIFGGLDNLYNDKRQGVISQCYDFFLNLQNTYNDAHPDCKVNLIQVNLDKGLDRKVEKDQYSKPPSQDYKNPGSTAEQPSFKPVERQNSKSCNIL